MVSGTGADRLSDVVDALEARAAVGIAVSGRSVGHAWTKLSARLSELVALSDAELDGFGIVLRRFSLRSGALSLAVADAPHFPTGVPASA